MIKYRKYIIIWILIISFGLFYDNSEFFGIEKDRYLYQEKILYLNEYDISTEPNTVTVKNDNLSSDEQSWITNYAFDGSPSYDVSQYKVSYDITNRYPIDYSLIYKKYDGIKMVPNTYVKGGEIKEGSFFYPSMSRYGVNCVTCSGEFSGHGNFSVGIGADVDRGVRQYDGEYEEGIKFEDYYIIATDSDIPLCTIVRFDEHNYEGQGIKEGVPFYAVVLDRGGAIQDNRVDFYIGDERIYNDVVWYTGSRKTKITIVDFGYRSTDASGQRSCKVPKLSEVKANDKY